jgi:hypothetical protein
MGRITIAIYHPKPGKESQLLEVIRDHMPILRSQNLITERKAMVMKAIDHSIIEIFEWKSREAIGSAHTNPHVLQLWERFNEVCTYMKPVDIEEFHNLFSEFEPVDIE